MHARILVVDDEPDMVELLVYLLRRDGWEVITADDGLTALKRARKLRPDLILLDVMLPGMDGFTVCSHLRATPETQAIPVILLTAMAGEMPRYHGLLHGATEFIRKPFQPMQLLEQVRKKLAAAPAG